MPGPHLFIVHGPQRGSRLPLERDKTVLGRSNDCHIVLKTTKSSDAISRKHAIITLEQGRYYIEDGDGDGKPSHNKTIVNSVPLPCPGRKLLHNTDLIKICDYLLRFHDGSDSGDSDSSSVMASVEHDSSAYLVQPSEKLQLLLEISGRLGKTLDLDRLMPLIVEYLLQLFRQATRGFLISLDESSGDLTATVIKARQGHDEKDARFSSTIVRQCLATLEGLLVSDPSDDAGSSFAGLALQSAMCAPLWTPDNKPIGALLVDSTKAKKKFTRDDLKLLMAVANLASIALANAQFHRDALARERLDRDLALAREVQRSFLPERVPTVPGYEFFACNESALAVGGDYYDFIDMPGGRLGILLGDVAGKGISASLIMTRFSGEARACFSTGADLAAAVAQLNTRLQNLSRTDRFVTLAALALEPATHTITVVNAGHPSPLLLRRTPEVAIEALSPRDVVGPPIGVFDGIEYSPRQYVLQRGDVLIVFTDGVNEAMDAKGRQWGVPRLRELLQKFEGGPAELGQRVLEAVQRHAAGCAQHDDITLVCLGRC